MPCERRARQSCQAWSSSSRDAVSLEWWYIPTPQFNRFAITWEINDGFLASRLAPSQQAWVLSGTLTLVSLPIAASIPQDADNRLNARAVQSLSVAKVLGVSRTGGSSPLRPA